MANHAGHERMASAKYSPPPCGEGLGVGVAWCQIISHDTCAATQLVQNVSCGSSSGCSSRRAIISEGRFRSATTSPILHATGRSASSLSSTAGNIAFRTEKQPIRPERPISPRVGSTSSDFGTSMCSPTWKGWLTRFGGNWVCDDFVKTGETTRPPPLPLPTRGRGILSPAASQARGVPGNRSRVD